MSDVDSGGLVSGPDEVHSGPPGTRFRELRRFHQLDSTNRYLLDVCHRQPVDGLVAVADHQTAGRGRLGRSWEAPAGANLLASVLLLPRLAPEELHLCTVAAVLAAAEACHQAASLEVALKWPNDLVVGDRKLAGVLAESSPVSGSDAGRAVVVGIGLNVRWPGRDERPGGQFPVPDELPVPEEQFPVPDELRHSATSIARETGLQLEPGHLLRLLLADLEHRLVELDSVDGRRRLGEEYRRRCSTLGRVVRVTLSGGELRGTAVDITPEGHLVVDSGSRFTTVSAGDIVHVHPER